MSILARTFFAQSQAHPDQVAIHCDDQSLTYAELSRHARRWSTALGKWGVEPGDHVGVVLPNCLSFVILMLAAADRGAVLVPQPISMTAATIASTFAATDVSHVVASAEILRSLRTAGQAGGLMLAIDAPADGVIGMDEFLKDVEVEPEPSLLAADDAPFILTTTSGSTGAPKPIILTQQTKYRRAFAAIGDYGVTASDITLAATPLYHSLAERLVLIPLLTGGTSVVMSRFSPKEWLSVIRRHGVTFTIAVSSQLMPIAQNLETEEALDSLRCVVSSSATMEASTKAALLGILRCDFHECYGASEIGVASNLDPEAARTRTETVGKAVNTVDIKILGDDNSVLPLGQIGEIVCKTSLLFGGYYKKPKETAAAMWGDYFRTGDLGKMDEDGFLTFVGRKKEIIITGGINVYPVDVESALKGFPGLKEAAAFAIADEQLGEIVGLALVPEPGQDFNLRLVRHHCARTLADYQQPRKFMILDALPSNAMGKLARRQLVESYLKKDRGHLDA